MSPQRLCRRRKPQSGLKHVLQLARAIVIIALVMVASVVAVLLAINLTKPSLNGIPGLPSSYVLLNGGGYLNGTKLFLVSAK